MSCWVKQRNGRMQSQTYTFKLKFNCFPTFLVYGNNQADGTTILLFLTGFGGSKKVTLERGVGGSSPPHGTVTTDLNCRGLRQRSGD